MKKNTRLVLLAVMLVLMVAMTVMVASAATIDVAKGEDLAAKVAGAAAGDTIKLLVGELVALLPGEFQQLVGRLARRGLFPELRADVDAVIPHLARTSI